MKTSTKSKSQTNALPVQRVVDRLKRAGWLASPEASDRVAAWFMREWQGSEADYRSPLFSFKDPNGKLVHRPYEEIRDEFDSMYQEVMKSVSNRHLRQLIDGMEEGQKKKMGPKSPYLPWSQDGPAKVDSLYGQPKQNQDFDEDAYERALERIHSLVSPDSINLYSIERAISGTSSDRTGAIDAEGMDVGTNSGLPYVVSPWRDTGNVSEQKIHDVRAAYDYIVNEATDLLDSMSRGHVPHWRALVGKRVVSSGLDWKNSAKKKRLIVAIEKTEPVLWKTFSPNLYDALRAVTENGVKPFMAVIDLPVIDKNCQIMLENANSMGTAVVSGDVSSFDQSVNPFLLDKFGPIIDSWIKGNTKLGSGLVTAMTRHVSLVTPMRIIGEKPMGMPSGSGGTNLMDSLYNLAILFYGEERGYYKLHNYAVQGDDFLALGEGVDQEAVEQAYTEVGMDANKDKQLYEPDALNYLQRIHYRGFHGGIASTFRTLNSSLVYERLAYRSSEWNAYVDIARNLSQLENCAFHPAFETLVDFVASGDRYDLGANLPPEQVIAKAGDTGRKVINQDQAQAWKSGHGVSGFSQMAVNGVLREEELPPHGSRERFSRVYGERAKRS